jgi:isopentenyl-diphosphate delta-isomerase
VQHEGETCFRGVLEKIAEIARDVKVPVIVKETGAGISSDVAKKLVEVGVSGIDVSGVGGTSWAGVEYYRAKQISDRLHARLGGIFWNWGISTVASLVEVLASTTTTVVASGGIRSGLDIAKSIALGASASSIALPLIRPALKGSREVETLLRTIIEELKTAMFLAGAKNIADLKKVPVVVTGSTREWLAERGFNTSAYAKRSSF